MRDTLRLLILVAIILVLGTISENKALAQTPAPSLEQSLNSQYPKGTVLNIGTPGVVGTIGCTAHPSSTFKDGKLHMPGLGQNLLLSTLKCGTYPIAQGTKVYLSEMKVYQKKNRVSFAVMQCSVSDCSSGFEGAGSSQVDFEFPKGFLETAQLGQVLEAINHVFTIASSFNTPAQKGTTALAVSPSAPPVIPAKVTPGSLYASSQNKADRLQLHLDNSFSLQEEGQSFSGSYSVEGGTLKLHVTQLGKDVDIVVQDNALVVNGAEIWTLAPGPLYINPADSADKVQLNLDGTFTLQEGGQTFTGTYSVAGATLKLHITQLQKDVDIVIQGNQLIVNGNESWISTETQSSGAPANPASPNSNSMSPSEYAASARVGKYVRKDKSSDYIELAADGKIHLFQGGKYYNGNYSIQGDVLTIQSKNIRGNGERFVGNTIVEANGTVWEKGAVQSEAQSPVISQPTPGPSKMTNDDVIKLVTAGLSEQVVTTAIRQAPTKDFDLTPTGLIALKKTGVSDSVIAAMQEKDLPVQVAAANQSKTPTKSDATLAAPPRPESAPVAQDGCADIDYLGVIQAVTGGGQMAGWNAYGGRIRNRASYTKEVDFAWVMNGRAETGTFRIPAGQFIDVNLGQGSAPPTNVRVVACR